MGRSDGSISRFGLVKEMRGLWNLKRGVSFLNLGPSLFIVEFEVAEETERVLRSGAKW